MIDFSERLVLVILHGQKNIYFLSFISPLEKIPKISICHMVENEHPEVIEGSQLLIAVDVIDSEVEAEDTSIVDDDSALDEEDVSGLVGAGVT